MLADPLCPSGLVSQPHCHTVPQRHAVPAPHRGGAVSLGLCFQPQEGSSTPAKIYQRGGPQRSGATIPPQMPGAAQIVTGKGRAAGTQATHCSSPHSPHGGHHPQLSAPWPTLLRPPTAGPASASPAGKRVATPAQCCAHQALTSAPGQAKLSVSAVASASSAAPWTLYCSQARHPPPPK